MEDSPRHQCLIYSGAPSEKLPVLATIIRGIMEEGYRCLYINSPAMVAGMTFELFNNGVDVKKAIAQNHLIFSSESVGMEGNFDSAQMLERLENMLDQALEDGYKGLWASGDMTWELGGDIDFERVMQYEWQLEALFSKRKELRGICQYHHDTLPQEMVRRGLITHQNLFVNETLSRINPHYISSKLSSSNLLHNSLLDKMIVELCQSNSETRRSL